MGTGSLREDRHYAPSDNYTESSRCGDTHGASNNQRQSTRYNDSYGEPNDYTQLNATTETLPLGPRPLRYPAREKRVDSRSLRGESTIGFTYGFN
jgi:hypothetical protein